MGILDKYLADQPAEPAPAPSTDSAFTKGLRSGMTSLGGQGHALLGQAGELVGADDFAASQRAQSVAAQQQAAQEREGMVESYKDVNGLRSAFDYTSGLIGSAVPSMAAGIAGAKLMPGKGVLPALTGATLATAPSTIGAQFEQQQAAMQTNPGQPQPGVIDRTLTGVGTGLAQAGIMNAVPQLVGGKFFGQMAGGATRQAMPLGRALAENVPEAVLGNAVAGVVSPLVGQAAASHLNPERDRSGDTAEMMEGAVSGAVMGVPFAALGTAGSMKGAKAPKPAEPLPRATEAEKAAGQPLPGAETAVPKTFAEKVLDLGTPLKKEPVTAEEHTAPIVQGDTPETMAAKDTAGASAASEKARRTMDKLLADQEATGLHKELGALDPSTSDGQARIGELNVQHFDAKQRAKAVADANAMLDKAAPTDEAGTSFSKDTSGVDAKIHAVLDKTRDWEYQSDDQRAAAANLLRKVIITGEEGGGIPPKAREAITLLLGKDPVGQLSEMYDAIGSKEPAKADRFYTALSTLGEAQKVDNTLLDVVRSALPEDMAGSVRMPQLKQFVAQMKDLTSEEAFKNMTPAEQAVKKQQVNSKLAEVFGDKADAVNEAFAKHAKAEAKLTVPDRTEALGAETDLGDTPAEAPPTYYGKKGDNPFLLNNEAHAREFPDTPDAQRPQSARIDTAMKNEEHGQVEWQSAREHAREVGMSKEELMRLTNDRPDDFGVVRAMPKSDDSFGLKTADIEAMKLGTHTRVLDPISNTMVNKRTAPKESWVEGPSTITIPGARTDLGGGRSKSAPDEHFDATRIASWMARQDGKNADRSVTSEAKGELYRTAQAFSEGIAALSDHYGRKIDVPDETVVVRAKSGEQPTTWGDLQQVLKDAALDDKGRTQVAALREQLRGPSEAYHNARNEARAKVERDNPQADMDQMVSLMGESDRAVKKQFAAERAAIEDLNAKIEEVHNAALDRQFAGSDKSTGELKQLVSDFTLRLDNAEQAVARFTAIAEKRALSEWQQKQLDRHQRTVKKMTTMIPNIEAAIERRADRAKFAEGKELGNDYGTGRDSGGGINLPREQQRAADSARAMYNDLLNRLDKHKPGSPGEGMAWKKEAERVQAQIITSFGKHATILHSPEWATLTKKQRTSAINSMSKAPDENSGSPEFRRMKRYQKLVEAKDRAGIEALRDKAEVAGANLAERAKEQELNRRDERPLGVSEIDPAAEIHLAEAQFGNQLGAVSARSRQVAGEYTPPARAKDVVRGPVENAAELNRRADVMQASKSENIKRTGDMLRGLLDNQEVMSPSDRLTLKTLLDAKTALKMGQSVKALFDKYSRTKGWSKEGKNSIEKIASETGPQHDAAMRQVARSTDAKALQESVLKLLVDRKPNPAKQELIDAMNDRISKLVERNPDAAYALLVKGNEPAGRDLFAAPDAVDDSFAGATRKLDVLDAVEKEFAPLRVEKNTLRELKQPTLEQELRLAEIDDKYNELMLKHDPLGQVEDVRREWTSELQELAGMRDPEWAEARGKALEKNLAKLDEFAKRIAERASRESTNEAGIYVSPAKPMDIRVSNLTNQIAEVKGHIKEGTVPKWYREDRKITDDDILYVVDPSGERLGVEDIGNVIDKVRSHPKGARVGLWELHKKGYLSDLEQRLDDFINGELSMEDNSDQPFSRAKTDPGVTMTSKERAKIVDHINKVTGNSVDVNVAAKMLYAGAYKEAHTDARSVDHRPAINVSVHALDPTSVGYHESLHWFADHLRKNGDPKIFGALVQTADSPYVRNVLRTVFKDQPEVLKQVMNSAEERVAYMYQLYASGNLKLGDRTKTILDKVSDYLKKVMGVWTNDQRAEHIMRYFNSGEYGTAMSTKGVNAHERSPMYRYLMAQGRNRTLDYLAKTAKPLTDLKDSVASVGSQRIRDMNIPALTKMADMVRLHGTQEGSDTGYLPAAGIEFRSWSSKLVDRMGEFSFDEANEAFAATAQGNQPKDAKQLKLMNAIDSIMTDMHAYMREAGVDIGERKNAQGKYTPRQWEPGYIAGHQNEFRAMIQKYIDSGDFKGTADQLMSRLMRDDGSEIESADFQARPGDQYAKKRELHFITDADAAPFLEKDAMRVLTSYIKQSTRRAEWARRFEAMTKDEKVAYAAIKQGATPEQMALVEKYMEGVTGQLGADVQPETRKLFGQLMVYQNLRLLPMGFFSSLIDPVGVAVRGGDVHDVFNNFKRGIMEIPRGFKKHPQLDEGYKLAEDMGVIDNAVLQHVMGASYGLNSVGNRARAINETLFKWNLMEQMNTSQRVAATEASLRFLAKHKDGDATPHSARYLSELGLKPGDIKMVGTGKDARVAARESDFKQLGLSDTAATAEFLKMRQAINSWVDGAVLRPDQSQKAIWMNDAHFSLIAHMKQFAFAFQDTILKRAMIEAENGNYQPAYALAAYIPVMLAADLVKGAIQGGGSQPDWKQDWTLSDYLSSATQRAGLLGVGQFGADALKDVQRGGIALGALGGPSLGQLSDVVSTVGGNRSFGRTVVDSMPANALWSGYLPDSATRSGAAAVDFGPTEPNNFD